MKSKKRSKKVYYAVIILFLFAVLTIHLLFMLNRDVHEIEKMDKKIADIQVDIEHVRNKNLKLRKQAELLENGQYVEKIAREELGMVKKDEIALLEIKNKEEKNEEDEDMKNNQKQPGTIELFRKNMEDFFSKLFHTISIKQYR